MSKRPQVDFYLVLGIAPSATPKEISAAFLSLARRHHPDSSGTQDESNSDFKAVAEAYAILSDPAKRRAYDLQRAQTSTHSTQRRVPVKPIQSSSALTTNANVGSFDERPRDSRMVADLPITPEEARWGASVSCTLSTSRCCNDCRGSGCPACRGRGVVSRRSSLQIRVPPGVCDGTMLSVPGSSCLLRIRIRPCW